MTYTYLDSLGIESLFHMLQVFNGACAGPPDTARINLKCFIFSSWGVIRSGGKYIAEAYKFQSASSYSGYEVYSRDVTTSHTVSHHPAWDAMYMLVVLQHTPIVVSFPDLLALCLRLVDIC